MAAPIPPMLKYSVVHNFLNSPPILIKFISKFMVCKVIYFKVAFPHQSYALYYITYEDCLHDLSIYISQVICHTMNKIVFIIQKLWTFNFMYLNMYGAALNVIIVFFLFFFITILLLKISNVCLYHCWFYAHFDLSSVLKIVKKLMTSSKRTAHYAFLLFYIRSKKISNNQELIQSDPISCPQNQKGNN